MKGNAFGKRYEWPGFDSNLQSSRENKICRAGQAHVGELRAIVLEAHCERVAARDLNLDGRSEAVDARGNEGRRADAGATRERFAFHPALKRAPANVVRSKHLNLTFVLRGPKWVWRRISGPSCMTIAWSASRT